MTAKNDDARLWLHQEKKSLDIILTVLKSYLELDVKVSSFYYFYYSMFINISLEKARF